MKKYPTSKIFGVVATLVSVACGHRGGSAPSTFADAEELRSIIGKPLILQVPDVCAAKDPSSCPTWLGVRDGVVQGTFIRDRATFSLEDLQDDGRFHIAAYPDCLLEQRATTEAASVNPVDAGDTPEAKQDVKTESASKDQIPPLLTDGSAVVQPRGNDDTSVAPLAPLTVSPLASCRRLITPGAAEGGPVALIDPATVAEDGWWKVHFKDAGYPVFVSTKGCEKKACALRLLYSGDGFLTATGADEGDLQLRSFWNKLKGSISSGFEAVESSVADIQRTIGSTVSVDDFGGKRLVIEAATRSVTYYSALKADGPAVLAEANGQLKDGAVYMQAGATAIKNGADYSLQGAQYVVQYIQNNVCFLGRFADLTHWFGQYAVEYDIGFQSGMTEYYNHYAGSTSLKAQFNDPNSPLHAEVILGIKAYALYSAISTATLNGGRLNLPEWESLITDIVVGAFENRIKGSFVPYIFSKVAKAQCKGTKEALSAAHALVDASQTYGMSDECLSGIRDRANQRYEQNGEDICFATRDEINIASSQPPPQSHWESNHCSQDPNDPAYATLLEGMGCVAGAGASTEVGETPIAPETVLDRDRWWGRTHDWHAVMACGPGEFAVGVCGSGENEDCYGYAKEIHCAGRGDGPMLKPNEINDFGKDWRPQMGFCPTDSVMTSFCSSGKNQDCMDMGMYMRCTRLEDKFAIDYNHCDVKESKSWTGRLEATKPNHAIVALCTSGKNPDCGENGDVTKGAMFCPIILRSAKPPYHVVHRFVSGITNLLATNPYENPWYYNYKGVAFNLYDDNSTGNRYPLYRCLSGGTDRFASTDPNCEGTASEGLLGWMDPSSGKAIWRCAAGPGQHYIGTEPEFCDGGNEKVIIGYAPGP